LFYLNHLMYTMVFADDIRKTILKLAEERGGKGTFDVADIARTIDQQNWRMLIDQVKLVAAMLVREGKISTTPSDAAAYMASTKRPGKPGAKS
jgi:hypothetical protein